MDWRSQAVGTAGRPRNGLADAELWRRWGAVVMGQREAGCVRRPSAVVLGQQMSGSWSCWTISWASRGFLVYFMGF